MNTLIRLSLASSVLALTACPDGTIDTDETDTDTITCMVDEDGDNRYDVYPASGALSAGDYTGCEVYDGPILLAHFPQPSCSGSWSYEFETQGWASGGILYSLDTAGGGDEGNWWWESHDLTDGSSEPKEWWDAYSLDLDVIATAGEYESNVNSLHQCAANDNATLVWGIEIYDFTNTDTVADCILVSGSETSDAWLGDLTGKFTNLNGCDAFRWSDQ